MVLSASCRREDVESGLTRVDTLPGGTIRSTSESPTWAGTARGWRLREAARYGGQDGSDGELSAPRQLALDDLGRLYVSDSRPDVIKVFTRDGKVLRTIGREGAGPGEFYAPLLAVRGRIVAVHDMRNARTSLFDTSGSFIRSWRSSCCVGFPIQIDTASRIYVPTSLGLGPNGPTSSPNESRGMPWVRYDSLGNVLDTLFAPRSEEKLWTIMRGGAGAKEKAGFTATTIPFTADVVFNLHPAGGFIHGAPNAYLFVISPNGKDTARIVARAWRPERIPDAMRTDAVNRVLQWFGRGVDPATVRSIVRLEDVPTAAPAFTGFRVDAAGNIWVMRLLGSDSTKTMLDDFTADGQWRGPVLVPVQLEQWGVDAWGKDELFAATVDEEGRPIIKRFRIIK